MDYYTETEKFSDQPNIIQIRSGQTRIQCRQCQSFYPLCQTASSWIYKHLLSRFKDLHRRSFYEDFLELTPKKKCSIHHQGLEYRSRKSRYTWSNRQVWPWRTKWSRVKVNWILPRVCNSNRKDPFSTTQEMTLHRHTTKWSIPK